MSNIFQPLPTASNITSTSTTLNASNTTANVPIFRITGTVEVRGLYGIVTTTIGTNHTGGYFRLNDQTSQTNITQSVAPTALSNAAVGTIILKSALAATVANVQTSAAGRFYESATAGIPLLSEFFITKKNGANTDIEYSYATTQTPTTGAIQFFLEWVGRSADAAVTAL
jgi:hypothetical protein